MILSKNKGVKIPLVTFENVLISLERSEGSIIGAQFFLVILPTCGTSFIKCIYA